MLTSIWPRCRVSVLLASAAMGALLLPLAAQAQTANIVAVTAGSTPFLASATASYTGTLTSVSYTIAPQNGSVTRPLGANYSANYLGVSSTATSGSVSIPIFGLYAGAKNTINLTFTFANGATNTVVPVSTTFTTASYTDPCASIANRALNASPFNSLLSRTTQSALGYDYFLLKDDCSTTSPAILDTDGNFRWVGSAGEVPDASLVNNAIFASDGSTSLNRFDITTGTKTTLANYASNNVTTTNQHNIDPGRNGLLLEVNTGSETEATILEINPATGAVMNTWDMGAIISAAMTAGGDSPSAFVLGTSADWFHNNSTTYNPADNTLIVSSRENFVIAVDYDAPASGQRQIHWILGDTTKVWYTYKSLAKYALTLGSNTLPPIGQHGISIDHQGNLLLFDDGFGGLTLNPAGVTRNYSAVRSYQINTTAMTATQVYNYTLADVSFADGQVFSPICGSVYDVGGSYLVDFATANAAASSDSPNGASTAAGNNALLGNSLLATGAQTSVILAGLGSAPGTGFTLQLPSASTCEAWNAVPLASAQFNFNGYVNAPALTVAPGSTGTLTVSISGLASAPTALGINGTSAVSSAIQYSLGANNASISAQFTNVTATSATLNVTMPTTVTPSTIPYELPITIGSAQVGIVTLIVPAPATPIVSVTGATLSVVPGNGGTVNVTISGASSAPTLALGQSSSNAYSLPGNNGTITYTFQNVSQSGASLVVNVPLTANSGSYSIPITMGTATVGTFALTVSQQTQTITFGAIAPQTVGKPLTLSASASSGLTVSFASTSPTVCTVSGATASFSSAGTCSITATQSGSANYSAAPAVMQSFLVSAAASTVSVSVPASTLAQGASSTFIATISGATSAPTNLGLGGVSCVNVAGCLVTLSGSSTPLNFEFSSVTTSGASLTVYVNPSVTPGTYAIPITLGSTVAGTFALTVPQQTQTIAFGAIATQTLGKPLTLSATASSGLTVSFASASPAVCTVSGTTASFTAAGTCSITASQSGNANYSAAPSVTQSFSVTAVSSTVSVTGATLSLAPGTGGTVTVTISGLTSAPTTLALGGNSTNLYSLGAAGSFNYTFLNVSQSSALLVVYVPPAVTPGSYSIPITIGTNAVGTLALTVPKQTQTITFGAIATQTVGKTLTLAATASSGLTVGYSSSTTSVCTVSGTTATFVGTGTCSITAAQSGNASYAAAASVTQSFLVTAVPVTTYGTVSPANLTLTFSQFFIFTTPGTGSVTLSGTKLPTTASSWTLSPLPAGVTYTAVPNAAGTSVVFNLSSGSDTTASGPTKIYIYNGGQSTGAYFNLTVN